MDINNTSRKRISGGCALSLLLSPCAHDINTYIYCDCAYYCCSCSYYYHYYHCTVLRSLLLLCCYCARALYIIIITLSLCIYIPIYDEKNTCKEIITYMCIYIYGGRIYSPCHHTGDGSITRQQSVLRFKKKRLPIYLTYNFIICSRCKHLRTTVQIIIIIKSLPWQLGHHHRRDKVGGGIMSISHRESSLRSPKP